MTHFNLNFTQGKQRGNLKKKKKKARQEKKQMNYRMI